MHITQNLYSWCFIAGILLNLLFVFFETRRYKMPTLQSFGLVVFEAMGMIFGAKLLACFQTGNYNIITAGFSSYGGLIGALFMVWLYSVLLKTKLAPLMCIAIIPMSLTYAVGKIGCFTAGCCHGIPYSGVMNVIYDNSKSAPHGASLFPVQLAEAVAFLLLFAAFYLYYRTHEFSAKHVCIYIMALSAVKGALYYLRDESIGNPLGSHQIICISLFLISIAMLIYITLKKRVKNREQLQTGL